MAEQNRHRSAFPDRTSVIHVGSEREPVVIVDAASGAPDRLVDFAASQASFAPAADVGSGYPGLLGTAPTSYVDWMVQTVLPLIERHFVAGRVTPVRARGNFSLVTTPPERLLPDQRTPHVDTADRWQFAAVHYLAPANADGTAFFRHRATGHETIDADRLPAYRRALDAEALPPRAAYPSEDDARFEVAATVPAMFDRLIVYRAALLHSGVISAMSQDADDPRRGRLTGNLFLQCRAA